MALAIVLLLVAALVIVVQISLSDLQQALHDNTEQLSTEMVKASRRRWTGINSASDLSSQRSCRPDRSEHESTGSKQPMWNFAFTRQTQHPVMVIGRSRPKAGARRQESDPEDIQAIKDDKTLSIRLSRTACRYWT